MLYAVGIASAIARDGREFILLVDVDDTPAAGEHLHLYEQERLARPPPPPPPPKLHPHALKGSIAYALVLYFVAYAISNGLWRLDAFDVGELNAGLVQQGQWWRVWTALTLHLDILHLTSNMAFGMWFGYLASRLLGVGNAWLLVVLGAGFANWVEGYFGPVRAPVRGSFDRRIHRSGAVVRLFVADAIGLPAALGVALGAACGRCRVAQLDRDGR